MPAAGGDREHEVARAPQPCASMRRVAAAIVLEALRQPAQAEQDQHRRDDLDERAG